MSPASAGRRARTVARRRRSRELRPTSAKPPGLREWLRACRQIRETQRESHPGFRVIIDGGSDRPNVSTLCGLNPGIDAPQLGQAADHQTRADEQHQRHRQFDDHEYALRAMACAARSAAALLQRLVQIRLEVLSAGSRPKRTPARSEMPAVKSRTWDQVQLARRAAAPPATPERGARSPRGQKQTEAAAGQRQQEAFGEQLADHARLGSRPAPRARRTRASRPVDAPAAGWRR